MVNAEDIQVSMMLSLPSRSSVQQIIQELLCRGTHSVLANGWSSLLVCSCLGDYQRKTVLKS